jgi:hypothetical protein
MLFRRIVAAVAVLALVHPYAFAFDTFWHAEAARRVGDEFGFSEDSRKIMQLGNFSPDFFGPVSDFASERLPDKSLQALGNYGANNAESRASAIFLHFDNLNGELDSNAKFDYIFTQLLQNTQSTLANFFKRTDADERTRKVLVLITLGASLHAVQDFYSHSDWIHHDFTNTGARLTQLPGGGQRAPTWFEFRDKAPDVANWPFQVKTGLYPPVAGAGPTHTHMNHDNSRLIYKEYETPGAPVNSEAQYHVSGNVPARVDDAAAITAHQQFAFNTAVAASIEWVKKVEENADAKAAIDFAKSWNLKLKDPKLAKELEAGLATQLALSCAAGKWDGEDPPADRGVLCKTVLDQSIGSASAKSASNIESILVGVVTRAAFPLALKYTGKFWDVHRQYHILDSLAQNIGSASRQYVFSKP